MSLRSGEESMAERLVKCMEDLKCVDVTRRQNLVEIYIQQRPVSSRKRDDTMLIRYMFTSMFAVD